MGIVLWPFDAEDAEENGEGAEGGRKRTFLAAKSVKMSFSKAGSCVMLFSFDPLRPLRSFSATSALKG
jgi:hypothetical protein